MKIKEIETMQNKLKELQKKNDTIFLIERFIKATKESECLDFSSQWGSAPTYCHLGEFNSTKISRREIYELFGEEVIDLLNNKKKDLENELQSIDVIEFLQS